MSFEGIAHPRTYRVSRRDALFFDTIGLVRLEKAIESLPPAQTKEIEWLVTQGVVKSVAVNAATIEPLLAAPDLRTYYTLSHAYATATAVLRTAIQTGMPVTTALHPSTLRDVLDDADQLHFDREQVIALTQQIVAEIQRRNPDADQTAIHELVTHQTYDVSARMTAIALSAGDAEAVPLAIDPVFRPGALKQTVVLSVVLECLPVPSVDTPWEAIVEFRSNAEAVQSLRRLRRWVRAFSAAPRSKPEVRDELEYLVEEYRRFMQVHSLKSENGRFEALVSVAADVLDNLAALRIGSAVKALFSVRSRRLELFEAELRAPGREVAYIDEARQRFEPTA